MIFSFNLTGPRSSDSLEYATVELVSSHQKSYPVTRYHICDLKWNGSNRVDWMACSNQSLFVLLDHS